MVLGQYRTYWLVIGGIGSVNGGTGLYLAVLGQKRAVLGSTNDLFWRVFLLRASSFSFISIVESFRVFLYINCLELYGFPLY